MQLKPWLFRFVFSLARTSTGGLIIRIAFAYASWMLPIQRLRETTTLIAFYHPQPTYPFHVLLVPKHNLPGLENLSEADIDFIADIYNTVQSLVSEFKLDKIGYQLITNGGKYQEVAQLHFHLVSEA